MGPGMIVAAPNPGSPSRERARYRNLEYVNMKIRALLSVTLLAAGLAGPALAQEGQQGLPPECGSLRSSYGPFDYRVSLRSEQLHVVETYHFDSNVESLRKGLSGTVGGDLSYTLRAFPNHHRALMSMIRLGNNLKVTKAPGASFSVSCFLTRAEVFQPEDAMVKVIYGIYFLKQGQRNLALEKLNAANALEVRDANTAYNLGLAFFEAGDYAKSLTNAHEAYRLGFPLPGLRDKLKRAGKWKEPAPIPVVSEQQAAPAAETPAPAALPSPAGTEAEE